jgi:hypothetical protein
VSYDHVSVFVRVLVSVFERFRVAGVVGVGLFVLVVGGGWGGGLDSELPS